ncbi:MAG: tetratricopeptide repeat protein [Anaerolineae bacterium]|nr:tetratricopeptide repeat protein [Anaerolineae bacterium]
MLDNDRTYKQAVRRALAHFHDTAYLRVCPLAEALLPVTDRGWALQRLLRTAVEHIKPLGTPVEDDRKWRPYWVLYYRYVQGQSRWRVMSKLAISDATFIRAQRKAIMAVCDFMRDRERDFHPPPVSPRQIPRIENFVGREGNLTAYRCQLEEEHLAVIVGPAGAGKTALGAELAAAWQAEDHPLLWVTLRNGRNVTLESLLEEIALSLAAWGQESYWRFLQAERRKETSLAPGSQVRYLLTILEQGEYTICLDDLQLTSDDPAINAFCADLLHSAEQRKLWLLVMSRVRPNFARGRIFKPLDGLGWEDARHLLAVNGLTTLPEAAFAELYTKTGGLPVFLQLFVAWAHNGGLANIESEEVRQKLVAFAGNMVQERDIRSYLLHQLYNTLTSQERRFLTCVAVFRLPIETEDMSVAALLKAEGVQDVETTLMALAERYIFVPLVGQNQITLHPLVRAYFARRLRLSPTDQARLHRRVGEYYECSVGDMLESGYHYFEAGDVERAARLLSENTLCLINAGQAGSTREQLERLASHLARSETVQNLELRFDVAAAREQLCHLLGLREKQKAALDIMQSLAEELSDDRLLALAYNRRSRFYRTTGKFTTAITAAQAGLKAARLAHDKTTEAESLQYWGVALWLCDDYVAARERHQQALALTRETGERSGEANNLNELGNIYYRLDELAAARSFYEQALDIWRIMGDQRGEEKILNNLGLVWCALGDYVTARECHEQALTIVRAIGDQQGEAASLNNLGVVYYNLGHYVVAREYYEQSLAIKWAVGDQQGQANTLNNLGTVWRVLGNYVAAREHFERSLVLKRAISDLRGEAHSLNNLGVVCYEEAEYTAAQAYYEQALGITRTTSDKRETGFALTNLGMVLERLGDLDGAEAAYRESLFIRREIGQAALAIEDMAGLGGVALARSRWQEAKQYAEECLVHITAHGVAGIEYVFEVYLTCVRVLEACGEHERAWGVLAKAHALLMERADKIEDETLHGSFLKNVPIHREVVQKWECDAPR